MGGEKMIETGGVMLKKKKKKEYLLCLILYLKS